MSGAQPSESVYWSLWSAINAYVEACGGDSSRSTGVVVAAMAAVYEAVDEFAASRVARTRTWLAGGDAHESIRATIFAGAYVQLLAELAKTHSPVSHAGNVAAHQAHALAERALEVFRVGSIEKRGGGAAGTPDTGGMIGRGGGNR